MENSEVDMEEQATTEQEQKPNLTEAQTKEMALFKQQVEAADLTPAQRQARIDDLERRFMTRAVETPVMAGGSGREILDDRKEIPNNEVVMVHAERPDELATWMVDNMRFYKQVVKDHGGKPPVILFDNLTPEELDLARMHEGMRARAFEAYNKEYAASSAATEKEALERVNLTKENIFKINHMARIIEQFGGGWMVEGVGRVQPVFETLVPNRKVVGELLEVKQGDQTKILENAPDLTDAAMRNELREMHFNKIVAEHPGAAKIIIGENKDLYIRANSKDPQGGLEERVMRNNQGLDIKNVQLAKNTLYNAA